MARPSSTASIRTGTGKKSAGTPTQDLPDQLFRIKEQVLREKELSDHIINSMPGIFYLFDDQGKFLRWNKNLETITGYSAREIRRMAPHEFFIPDHQELIRDRLVYLFANGTGQGSWTMLTRNGTEIPHYFTSKAILYEGKPCLIGAGIDMSAQRIAEENTRISDERYRTMEKTLLTQELDRQKIITLAVLDAQEKDRTRIGRELHDNISQILTTTKLYLELADSEKKDSTMLIRRSVESIQAAIDGIRNISRSLVAHSIADLGLIDSIGDLVRNINETKAIQARYHISAAAEKKLSDKVKLMVFRIIQEQINNILRHSGARNLNIDLVFNRRERRVELSITDDGRGFDPKKVRNRKGLGLSNIHSRAELIGGRLRIESSAGQGCLLNVVIPV